MFNRFSKMKQGTQALTSRSTWKGAIEQDKLMQEATKNLQMANVPQTEALNVPGMGGGRNVKSPVTLSTGIVNIPEGLPEAEIIQITVNTEGELTANEIVLGKDTIYRKKGGTGFTGNPAGLVYSKAPTATDTYDLWIEDLCVNTYVFHMTSIEAIPTPSDSTNGQNAKNMLYGEFEYFSGDVQGRTYRKTIYPRNARNPFQQDNDIIMYVFEDGENRLDSLSCYVFNQFLPNVDYKWRLYVTGVVNGRI
jgi:hypothetical protein